MKIHDYQISEKDIRVCFERFREMGLINGKENWGDCKDLIEIFD